MKDVAHNRQIEVYRSELVAVWGVRQTLEEALAIGDSVNVSLRAELALKDAIIESQARELDPPFTIEFFNNVKVAVPAIALGFGLGMTAGG